MVCFDPQQTLDDPPVWSRKLLLASPRRTPRARPRVRLHLTMLATAACWEDWRTEPGQARGTSWLGLWEQGWFLVNGIAKEKSFYRKKKLEWLAPLVAAHPLPNSTTTWLNTCLWSTSWAQNKCYLVKFKQWPTFLYSNINLWTSMKWAPIKKIYMKYKFLNIFLHFGPKERYILCYAICCLHCRVMGLARHVIFFTLFCPK